MSRAATRTSTARQILTLAAMLAVIATAIVVAPWPGQPAAESAAGDGPALGLSKDMPSETLYGDTTDVTLTASNSSVTDTFNASFRDVLPDGVSLDTASIAPTTSLDPGDGTTVLIWENVGDLQAGTSLSLSYTISHDTGVFGIGSTITNDAAVYSALDVRDVPDFDPTTGVADDTSYDSSAFADATTELVPFLLEKDEPNTESELLRGLHDHQTVYTLEVTNNLVLPTTDLAIEDWLPAGVEFLGCGTVDNTTVDNDLTTPAVADEYPGSGAINPGNAPALTEPCPTPSTVETLDTDPDGTGPLPSGVYTHVVWTASDIAAGAIPATSPTPSTYAIQYVAAIPLRQNVLFPTAPDTTGSQTANLDNNTGALTADEQSWENYAIATGTTGGTSYDDDDTEIVIAEDVSIHKSEGGDPLGQGLNNTWTLLVETSEYATDSGSITVTDTVPDGLSVVSTSPTADTVTENADGTWTIVWLLAGADAVPAPSDSTTLTITTIGDDAYTTRGDIPADTPISTNDTVVNVVDLATTDATIITDNDATTTLLDPPDASSADISSGGVELIKEVSEPGSLVTTPADCFDAAVTWTKLGVDYTPGDRVCWRLTANFQNAVDTPDLIIRDYLPDGYTFESQATTSNHDAGVPSFTDFTDYQEWTYPDIDRGGLTFQVIMSTILTDPDAITDGDLTTNLAKMTYQNIDNDVFQLRDDADAEAVKPVIGIDKAITAIADTNGDPVAGTYPTDSATVQGDDDVSYAVTVDNTGSRDAENATINDVLPPYLDCTVVVSAISAGGSCLDATTIQWTGQTVPAGGSITLTYDVTVPADVDPARVLTNTATVESWEVPTNTGIPTLYTDGPSDTATIQTDAVAITKNRTTSITEAGNAANNEATIGEVVSYDVTVTIPEGTTLSGPITLTDDVSERLTIVGTPTATLNGVPQAVTTGAGQVLSVTVAAPYVNGPTSGDDILLLQFDARVDDDPANTRTGSAVFNQAAFSYVDADASTVTRTAGRNTQIVEPNVGLAKDEDDADDLVAPNDELTYTVTVSNPDDTNVSTAHDAVVTDMLPAQVTPLDALGGSPLADGASTTSGGVWDLGTRTITWTADPVSPTPELVALAAIAPDATVDLSYVVRVNDPVVGSSVLTNNALVAVDSLPAGDPEEAFERDAASPDAGTNYSAAASDTVNTIELGITKSTSPDTATIGETVTSTIDVTIPAGTITYDTVVVDTLPAGLTYLSTTSTSCDEGGGACSPLITVTELTPSGQTIGWELGDLDPAASGDRVVTIVYEAFVDGGAAGDGDTLVNSAVVYGNQTNVFGTPPDAGVDPTAYENDAGPATDTVDVLEPTLTIDKDVNDEGPTDDTRRAEPGDTLTFTLTVENTGTSTAYDATVTDAIVAGTPASQTELGTVADGAGYTVTDGDPSDGTLSWTIPTLAAGASTTITYDLVVPAGLTEIDEVAGAELINTADIPSYFGLPSADRVPGRFVEYDDVTDDVVSIELDLASIGDRVWFDIDGDGVQDGGDEYGFVGVDVLVTFLGLDGTLGTPDDEAVTVTTGADGIWLVEDLPGGDYVVDVDESTLPSGVTVTFDLDDGTTTPDGTWAGTLGEDEAKRDVDTGYNGDSSLGDTVWLDRNRDGVLDGDEVGLPAVDVDVTWAGPNGTFGDADDVVYPTTTAADGTWTVGDLPAGQFRVDVDETTLPGGLTATYDLDDLLVTPDGTWEGALGIGEAKTDVDTGYAGDGELGDLVWLDLNGDGTIDADEPGIPAVDVTLEFGGADGDLSTSADNFTLTTTTDADGLYGFDGLPDGTFRVTVDDTDLPADLSATFDDDGTGTLHVSETTLSPGNRTDLDQDFGYQGPGSIGDLVWLDLDGDGTQDADEPGLGGVDVTVTYLGPDGVAGGGDDVTFATTTDANGAYDVSGLPTGNFTVAVDTATLPAGVTPTFDGDGTGTPDVSAVTLTAGTPTNDGQDFGYGGAGSLGDLVWLDRDSDGVQDLPDASGNGGEPGLPGVDVTVTYLGLDGVAGGTGADADLVFDLTTDADGLYGLTGLPDGAYTVEVDTADLPAGVTQTFDASGDQTDSTSAVSLAAGARDRDDQDFGYAGVGEVGDLVWLDQDGDTSPAGEQGIPAVDVTLEFAGADGDLTTAADNFTLTTTTDADGLYGFDGLPDGTFRVTVDDTDLPADLSATFDDDGTGTLHVSETTLSPGNRTDLDQDFGYQGPGSIGDLVWLDLDGDGTQDADEPGLGGVDVTVTYLGPDGVAGGGDDVTFATTTDANGAYDVSGLPTGNFTVAVDTADLPAGVTPTFDGDGTGTPDVSAVTLTAGTPTNDGQDFGYGGAGSLGDLVWLDRNSNDVQDLPDASGNGGEPGLPGVDVTVTYLGLDGVAGGTGADADIAFDVTTDADGLYGLTGLPDGAYTVEVDTADLPAGVTQTFDASGDQTDSTSAVSLAAGARDRDDQDFGYAGSSSLGDLVWLDTDENGLFDTSDEAGIPDVVLTIDYLGTDGVAGGTGNDTDLSIQVTTDADGLYGLDGLPAGEYVVRVTGAVPAALTATYDEDDGTASPDAITPVTLGVADDHLTADFGFAGSTSLGDRVWWDLNDDGVQDPDEPGLNGVTLELTAPGVDGVLGTADDVTTTTTTSGDGDYLFPSLSEGEHRVTVTSGIQTGFTATYDLDSGTTSPDETSVRTLGTDEVALDVDFGYVGAATLGDFVWLDTDSDGVQDAGEPGIGGVDVTLTWLGPDGVVGGGDDATLTTTTDATGFYEFTGLPDGNFLVEVVPTTLPGVAPTFDAEGAADGAATVAITGQLSRSDVDFGYAGTASVGDTVWLDLVRDGTEGIDEPGIPEVDVTLVHAGRDGTFGTIDDLALGTTTGPDGDWTIGGLPAGAVRVTVDTADLPADVVTTGDPDGGLDDTSLLTLATGEANLDQDFGYAGDGTLGDRLWLDLDGDGTQDAGEPGLPGIPVTVVHDGLDATPGTADDITMSTTSGLDGLWLFENLPSGGFTVTVDTTALPAGLTQTGDPDAALDASSTVTLAAAGTNLDQDFGWQGGGTLGDLVWFDRDEDGVFDPASEFGFDGVDITVTLLGPDATLGTADDVAVTTTTDADGLWQVTGLPAGTYAVTVDTGDLPAGVVPTFDADGGDDSASETTLPIDGTDLDQDFGYVGDLGIGDTIVFDIDADGVVDDGEPGLPGVTVELRRDGLLVDTTTTDADGTYLFEDLVPGTWTVTVDTTTLPPGLRPTGDADGVGTPDTSTTTLVDADDLDQDFAYTGTSSIGDLVFDDRDADGLQGPDEGGVADVVVRLSLASDPFTPIATTTTDADGGYLFENLRPDDYIVTVETPDGYAPSPVADAGTDDNVDSDTDPVTGVTSTITLPADTADDTVDGGLVELGSIGDQVFDDRNGDGVQDPGEPGLPDVEVRLVRDGDVVRTTTTDSDGTYLFDGLLPGDYVIEFVLPDGVIPTAQDASGDDATDSDIDTDGAASVTLLAGVDDDTVDAGVRLTAELDVAKVLEGVLQVGEEAAYLITVTNRGPWPVPGEVIAVDELPDGLTFVAADGDGWSCTEAAGIITCTLAGGLEVDESTELVVIADVTAEAGTSIVNEVDVSAAGTAGAELPVTAVSGSELVQEELADTGVDALDLLVLALLAGLLGTGLLAAGRRRLRVRVWS